MSEISKIQISSGETYDIKDTTAREKIAKLQPKLTPGENITIDSNNTISASLPPSGVSNEAFTAFSEEVNNKLDTKVNTTDFNTFSTETNNKIQDKVNKTDFNRFTATSTNETSEIKNKFNNYQIAKIYTFGTNAVIENNASWWQVFEKTLKSNESYLLTFVITTGFTTKAGIYTIRCRNTGGKQGVFYILPIASEKRLNNEIKGTIETLDGGNFKFSLWYNSNERWEITKIVILSESSRSTNNYLNTTAATFFDNTQTPVTSDYIDSLGTVVTPMANDEISALADRVTANENNIEGLDKRVTFLEGNFSGMEENLTDLNTKTSKNASDISSLSAKITQVDKDWQDGYSLHGQAILDLRGRIDGIYQRVLKLEGQIK